MLGAIFQGREENYAPIYMRNAALLMTQETSVQWQNLEMS